MEESDEVSAFQLLDGEGRIAVSLDCVKCGYDLRGRRLDEQCSECGEIVRRSARYGELRIGRPATVRTIRAMARLLQFAAVMIAVLPLMTCAGLSGPLGYLLILIPAMTALCVFVVMRLATIRTESAPAAIVLMLLVFLLVIWSVVLIGDLGAPPEAGLLTMLSWFIVYYFCQHAAIAQFAAIDKLLGLELDPRVVSFGALRNSVRQQGACVLFIVFFVASSRSFEMFETVVAISGIVALGWQWVFSFALMVVASAIRSELRAPPNVSWLDARRSTE